MNADTNTKSPDTTNSSSGASIARVLWLTVLLAAAWVLWSGFFKPLLLALGALSCVLTLIIVRRMGYLNKEAFAFHYDFRLIGYWGWLGKEVVLSSLEVAREVLRRDINVIPSVVKVDASELSLTDQALLGNSITLTPGTLTLDVHEGRLLVHALTPQSAQEVEKGEMLRRVTALGKN